MKDAAAIGGFISLCGGLSFIDWRWALIVGGGLLLGAAIWGHVRT